MDGLLIPAMVEGVSTRKDHTVKVVIATQELSPSRAGELLGFANKLVCVYISPKETISQKEKDQVDQLNPEFGNKTQSQRMRNVLYKLFEQKPEGFATFDTFYHHKTELIIDHLKTKLEA